MTQQTKLPDLLGEPTLSAQDIAGINYVRQASSYIGDLLNEIAQYPGVDMRWLALARTDLQKGFMFAERAIARPERF